MSDTSIGTPIAGVATRVATRVERILAPNAGAWTFEGTNTWVLGAPDARACAVVDPGPAGEEHLRAVLDAAGDRCVTEILLTHDHNDHAGGARQLAAKTGAVILAHRSIEGSRTVDDGDRVLLAGHVAATVLATPGHTRDSVCIFLPDDDVVFTGDTLLGAGSPVVHPALLFEMLGGLRMLAHMGDIVGLPGHGPVIPTLRQAAQRRIAARTRRIEQVAALQNSGHLTVAELVSIMYEYVDDPDVLRAAHSSVEAMVTFLDSGRGYVAQLRDDDRDR